MAAIVQQESGGNELLLHDNTSRKTFRPSNAAESAKLTNELIKSGHSVDIGLAQINSKNLPMLKLSVEDALDPCINLHAAQTILKTAWKQSGHELRGTLSAYNTGKTESLVGAQYSKLVFAHAGVDVPGIPGGKMSIWANHDISWTPSTLPPIRPVITWIPAASPLRPAGDGLTPKNFD
jgi:type IV secretion system protein VirB1